MQTSESDEAKRLCDDGFAALEGGRFDDAREALVRARTLAPDDPLVHFRLALLFVDTGRPAEALAALDASLRLQPDNARAHNNRGSALQLLDRLAEAETAFRRALDLLPALTQPYTNLGHLLEQQGKRNEAAEIYLRAIARGLDPALFGHELARLEGKATDRAPERWVQTTFDNFAPTFDERLRALGYNAPEKLAALLKGRASGPLRILDLGCGTGLCGVALAPVKSQLTGVDLSEKMLMLARARGLYDDLHASEIQAWLAMATTVSFDVVVAADVFIYIGALEDVFRHVSRVLRPAGWFLFSTEECAASDYVLQPTGRFAHTQDYIGRLAQPAFTIVAADPAVIRNEAGRRLPGRLYLLRRIDGSAD